MKFRKVLTSSGLALILGIGMIPSVAANTPSTGSSKTSVGFTKGTSAVDPVDPLDPVNPNPDPDPDGPTGNIGPLTLDYAPRLDFGIHEVSSKTENYKATSMKPYIQVTDRRGTFQGWTVTAYASPLINTSTSSPLIGADITFTNSKAERGFIASGSPDALGGAPEALETFKLPADGKEEGAITVLSASYEQGIGTWIDKWLPNETEGAINNSVTLKVPGGVAQEGSYTGTIKWTLESTPNP